MPLARLSIKSALRLARGRVSVKLNPDTSWTISAFYSDGSPLPPVLCPDRASAKAKQRELRIYVALLLLGAESTDALPAALAATAEAAKAENNGQTVRPWREIVAHQFERLSLSGKIAA